MARWMPTLLVVVLAAGGLAGCIGDAGTSSLDREPTRPTGGEEIALPADVQGLEHRLHLDDLETAKVSWIEGDTMYVAAESAGLYILDVSDPLSPQVVGHATDATGRDVDVLTYEDGRRVAVVADSADGMRFVDVTDPADPAPLATILGRPEANVHNVAVVPGTHLIYNSRSLDAPGVDIVDASDPSSPERVAEVRPELTCHDVTFLQPDPDATATRAYCAGVYQTQIWDLADPTAPEVLGRVVNPSITIHHWAMQVWNGSLLVIGDEFLGATGPWSQGCLAGTDDPLGQGTRTDPVGAVWFYDISDESDPQLEGYVGADQLPGPDGLPLPCTAHFGDAIPGQDKLVVDFIRGGTYLIDHADPSAPKLLDHVPFAGESWEVRYHRGVAYTTNTARGLDVLGFVGAE